MEEPAIHNKLICLFYPSARSIYVVRLQRRCLTAHCAGAIYVRYSDVIDVIVITSCHVGGIYLM